MRPTSLDPLIIEEIREMQIPGEADIFGELAKLFLETMQTPAALLRDAAALRDFAGVAEAAHMIKSGSSNVGALRLSDISRQLEAFDQGWGLPQLDELIREFDSEFAAVTSELALLASAQP